VRSYASRARGAAGRRTSTASGADGVAGIGRGVSACGSRLFNSRRAAAITTAATRARSAQSEIPSIVRVARVPFADRIVTNRESPVTCRTTVCSVSAASPGGANRETAATTSSAEGQSPSTWTVIAPTAAVTARNSISLDLNRAGSAREEVKPGLAHLPA
jgi:hypothetical protein